MSLSLLFAVVQQDQHFSRLASVAAKAIQREAILPYAFPRTIAESTRAGKFATLSLVCLNCLNLG
jgi:hypothetical protein